MHKRLSALAISAALLLAGTGCSLTQASASAPVTTPAEDEAGFDCLQHGNLICGPVMLTEELSKQAWDTFDAQDGARQVQVDPTRPFRVDLGRYSRTGFSAQPGSVVLADPAGFWFEYVVTYTD